MLQKNGQFPIEMHRGARVSPIGIFPSTREQSLHRLISSGGQGQVGLQLGGLVVFPRLLAAPLEPLGDPLAPPARRTGLVALSGPTLLLLLLRRRHKWQRILQVAPTIRGPLLCLATCRSTPTKLIKTFKQKMAGMDG
jgi:hypothetical protein